MARIWKIAITGLLFASLVLPAAGLQVVCLNIDEVISQSSVIILGNVQRVVLTYWDRPQMYNAPAESQYNVTVFQVSILKLTKGFTVSPVYVIGDERDSNATFTVGERYVLFLSAVKESCAPSPPYSPCTLPPTRDSSTYYIEPRGKFRVLNNVVFYGYQGGGPCSPLPSGVPLDQFMFRISYLSYDSTLTITTALVLGLGSGVLFLRRRVTS